MGSTCMARRAGIQPAKNATASRTNKAEPRRNGSCARTSKSKDSRKREQSQAPRIPKAAPAAVQTLGPGAVPFDGQPFNHGVLDLPPADDPVRRSAAIEQPLTFPDRDLIDQVALEHLRTVYVGKPVIDARVVSALIILRAGVTAPA